jgi:hypothetical protein
MPRGDKSSYTEKQQRKAEPIQDGYRRRGVGKNEPERRAWRTVNKQDGGAKKKRAGTRSRRTGGARLRKTTAARKSTRSRSTAGRSRSRSSAKRS